MNKKVKSAGRASPRNVPTLNPFLISQGDHGHVLVLGVSVSGTSMNILHTGKTQVPAQYSAEFQLQSTTRSHDAN